MYNKRAPTVRSAADSVTSRGPRRVARAATYTRNGRSYSRWANQTNRPPSLTSSRNRTRFAITPSKCCNLYTKCILIVYNINPFSVPVRYLAAAQICSYRTIATWTRTRTQTCRTRTTARMRHARACWATTIRWSSTTRCSRWPRWPVRCRRRRSGANRIGFKCVCP